MAKKINPDEIDEGFIIASVRKNHTIGETEVQPLSPLPATVPTVSGEASDDISESPVHELPKDENRRRRQKSQDYETLFIRESPVTARIGKTVYIRKEFHIRIQKIVQTIGNNEVSLFSYIDNMIAHHFDTWQDDIVRSYNKKNNDIF